MTFHANGGLHHREAMHARRGIIDDKAHESTKVSLSSSSSSSSASSSHTGDSTTSLPKGATSVKNAPTRATSPLVASHSPTTTPKVIASPAVNNGNKIPATTPSPPSLSSNTTSVPGNNAATITPAKSSIVGYVIGAFAAVAAIVLIANFIVKRTRKRRDRLNEPRYFNNDSLDQPGMVQDMTAGRGFSTLSPNNYSMPPSFHSDEPQMSRRRAHPADPFSPVSPMVGSPFESQQDLAAAPPMPGSSGIPPYSPYTTPFSNNPLPNQANIPPGSPFAGPNANRNPFTTPPPVDRRFSPPPTPGSAAWPHSPMGMPLLPGGAFGTDGSRDSGYSAMSSEAHVGQAYKVQVRLSMPKYEDLTRNTSSSPPPPFTPFDSGATVKVTAKGAHTAPVPVHHAAAVNATPPRPATIYSVEDAYGGM